jgi:hypothetical protein
LFAPGRSDDLFHRHGRAEEHGAPASGFGQPQKVHDSGDMDTLAKRTSNDGFQ